MTIDLRHIRVTQNVKFEVSIFFIPRIFALLSGSYIFLQWTLKFLALLVKIYPIHKWKIQVRSTPWYIQRRESELIRSKRRYLVTWSSHQIVGTRATELCALVPERNRTIGGARSWLLKPLASWTCFFLRQSLCLTEFGLFIRYSSSFDLSRQPHLFTPDNV